MHPDVLNTSLNDDEAKKAAASADSNHQ